MSDDNVEKINGYTIRINQEESVNDPRKEFDHAAKMYCEHRRYTLGDKGADDPREFDENTRDKMEILNLYLYDHSGTTISCSPFNDPWDSGQVGFIYMTANMIRENFAVKRISQKTRERARELMRAEVEEYDMWMTGDVWYYAIEDSNGEIVDSCGWMYGYDYCLESACEIVKGLPFQLSLPLEDDGEGE